MDTWHRPYPIGAGRWVVAVWEAAALVFLHRTSVGLYHLTGWREDALSVVLAAAWLALCVRLVRMGLFVGAGGVQIRGLVSRRSIPWREIERITVQHVSQKVFGLRIPAGRTAVIELTDGRRVNSSLWAEGVDFKFSPARFRQACDALRAEHATARQSTPGDGSEKPWPTRRRRGSIATAPVPPEARARIEVNREERTMRAASTFRTVARPTVESRVGVLESRDRRPC